jgi:predicted phosphodiesterase
MGRIAVLSDVHGNLEAFEAVVRALTADQVDRVMLLGDLVGYNANPRECIQLAQSRKFISILGNHDLATLEPSAAEGFNVLAYQAIKYVHSQLTKADLGYLRSLPQVEVLWGRYVMCHGTPESVDTYIFNLHQAKRIFNLLRRSFAGLRVCFFGHTHVQKLWLQDARGKVTAPAMTHTTVIRSTCTSSILEVSDSHASTTIALTISFSTAPPKASPSKQCPTTLAKRNRRSVGPGCRNTWLLVYRMASSGEEITSCSEPRLQS